MESNSRLFSQSTLVLVVIALLSITACSSNRYEIIQDKQGRILRLDRRTGEVALIRGNTVIKLKSAEEQEAKKEVGEEPALTGRWKTTEDALKDPDFHKLPVERKRGILRNDPRLLDLPTPSIDDILGKAWNRYGDNRSFGKWGSAQEATNDPEFYKLPQEEKREVLIGDAGFRFLSKKEQDEALDLLVKRFQERYPATQAADSNKPTPVEPAAKPE
jgi:hypothetical protein